MLIIEPIKNDNQGVVYQKTEEDFNFLENKKTKSFFDFMSILIL
jgi:hypothetical protein